MWGQACVDSYYPKVHKHPECNADSDGVWLPANSSYTVQLWARSDNPSMRIEILSGAWKHDAAEAAAFHTVGTYIPHTRIAGKALNQTWQFLKGVLPASSVDVSLQLQFSGGPGMVFVDNTFIGKN